MLPDEKLKHLKSIIQSCESAVIAFSGGADSSLVCAVAHDLLGERAVAVTAMSPTYPPDELEVTKEVAKKIGIKHLTLTTNELEGPNFISNPPDRCYYCKRGLFQKLDEIRKKLGFKKILDGTNFDDISAFRPGLRALKEFEVASPLAEAGLAKEEVRRLAANYRLPNADKPASPCLATRIPFGQTITLEKLERVARAESSVRSIGFRVVRVRDHNGLGVVEVDRSELARAKELEGEILAAVKKAGYASAMLDRSGYREGGGDRLV
jgi:uncharacterized protein